MNYGLYLSASGVLTNMYRQDVFSNNLANVQTAGFKRDIASLMQRDPEAIEDPQGFDTRQELLDRLGGGVLAGPQRISLEPGALLATGQQLDAALETPNVFFSVAGKDAQGHQTIRLTRDGSFTRDADGTLVTVAGGNPVLDDSDQPIRLGVGELTITSTGRVIQNGQTIAQLGVAGVKDPDRLVKQGKNLLGWTGGGDLRTPTPPEGVKVRQGFVEQSNVDPVTTLMNVIEATRGVTDNGNMIRYHDLLMDRAVNVLGRVSA